MSGHGGKLERKQDVVIAALLTQPSAEAAAKVCGVSEGTIWRWMRDPEFAESYAEARRRCLEMAISRLQQLAGKAVETLVEVMQDATVSAVVRVSAARHVLDYAFKGAEILDMEERLSALEYGMGRLTDDGKGTGAVKTA